MMWDWLMWTSVVWAAIFGGFGSQVLGYLRDRAEYRDHDISRLSL